MAFLGIGGRIYLFMRMRSEWRDAGDAEIALHSQLLLQRQGQDRRAKGEQSSELSILLISHYWTWVKTRINWPRNGLVGQIVSVTCGRPRIGQVLGIVLTNYAVTCRWRSGVLGLRPCPQASGHMKTHCWLNASFQRIRERVVTKMQ